MTFTYFQPDSSGLSSSLKVVEGCKVKGWLFFSKIVAFIQTSRQVLFIELEGLRNGGHYELHTIS